MNWISTKYEACSRAKCSSSNLVLFTNSHFLINYCIFFFTSHLQSVWSVRIHTRFKLNSSFHRTDHDVITCSDSNYVHRFFEMLIVLSFSSLFFFFFFKSTTTFFVIITRTRRRTSCNSTRLQIYKYTHNLQHVFTYHLIIELQQYCKNKTYSTTWLRQWFGVSFRLTGVYLLPTTNEW